MLSPMESLSKEKKECAELLETIGEKINSKNPEFVSHLLLSIFKMAEVEIVPIEASSASVVLPIKLYLVIVASALSILFKDIFFTTLS
ncbi:hypothetical protein Trydic_g18581 [Trypoxylus dichotomus]